MKRLGLSEGQARAAAKSRGFTDKQINAVIENERSSAIKPEENFIRASGKYKSRDDSDIVDSRDSPDLNIEDENTDQSDLSIESKTENFQNIIP